jgi:hypothetical protein
MTTQLADILRSDFPSFVGINRQGAHTEIYIFSQQSDACLFISRIQSQLSRIANIVLAETPEIIFAARVSIANDDVSLTTITERIITGLTSMEVDT